MSQPRLDIEEPLWDQSTFVGRFKHFLWVTDPRTVFVGKEELLNAKSLIEKYKQKKEPKDIKLEEIIYAKKLYESAFHPDTGDLQNVFGRMSFQMPGGMLITGAMMQFYRTAPAVIFWQWVNQSFNALVNYTNRNAKSSISVNQLAFAYVSATASALVAALGCKSVGQKFSNPILQRYVPFVAVASANFVNIPLMRQNELMYGIELIDENGNKMGQSKMAAVKGISQVVFSRIVMCAPGMLIFPVIMERMEKLEWMKRMKFLHAPIQVLGCGAFLLFMVPTACALFPQKCTIKTSTIKRFEADKYEEIEKKCGVGNVPERLYFNKGL